MLTWIKLKGFKSFEEQEIPVAPTTLLVGANAAGKSNVLDALRFLQGLALGYSVTDTLKGVWEGGRSIWPPIRGEIKEAAFAGQSSFSIETAWEIDGIELWHGIECAVDPDAKVIREFLWLGEHEYLFDTHAPALKGTTGPVGPTGINVALRRKPGKGNSATATLSALTALFYQLTSPASSGLLNVRTDVFQHARALRAVMASQFFLDPRPSLMRDYVSKRAPALGSSGENLSAVLWQMSRDAEQKEDIIEWLQELCAPEMTDMSFVDTELGDVMLKVTEKGGAMVSARSMSDGTLRFLCELVALKSIPEGSLLFIEEIDNGLHPTRLFLLVDMLVQVAMERNVQIIATTHSPTTLRQLPPDVLGKVVVFGRVPGRAGTIAARLADIPHAMDTAAKYGIDHLFTTGWLERAL